MYKLNFVLALAAAQLPAASAQGDHGSIRPVWSFPTSNNVPSAGATSTLDRGRSAVKVRIRTDGLDPNSPYTVWLVVFDRPEHCKTQPCSGADLPVTPGHDPRVDASIIFAGGGVTDAHGNGDFLGRVRKLAGRATGEIVMGTGSLDTRNAEIHVVVRGHGYPPADQIFSAIHSFAGGCEAPNTCEDQQFAIHEANR